jgi:hypothetical protein
MLKKCRFCMYLKHRTGWVMFVNKIFQLVKPYLANLRSSRSKKYSSMYLYSMTPQIFFLYFVYEYKKYEEFYADSKSIEITGKKCTQKKLFVKKFCKLVPTNSNFAQLFCLYLSCEQFIRILPSSFEISTKFSVVLIPISNFAKK